MLFNEVKSKQLLKVTKGLLNHQITNFSCHVGFNAPVGRLTLQSKFTTTAKETLNFIFSYQWKNITSYKRLILSIVIS